MKIGIFGGTFDPPHLGHLAIARAAVEELELDQLIFVPAGINPFKTPKKLTPGRKRLEMVRLMISGEEKMTVSDIELRRNGPSYTIDTLKELHVAIPGDYWIIIGADNLQQFSEWMHSDRILRSARIGVAGRPGTDFDLELSRQAEFVAMKIDFIPMELSPISATDIRSRLANGKSCSEMLAAAVLQYIEAHNLYSS